MTMKHTTLIAGLFASVFTINAQYSPVGWVPGEQTTTVTSSAAAHAFTPGLINSILASGPVASFFEKIGINITSALEKPKYWDERIPLITDGNYNDIIVNEPLTAEEEQTRTWAIVITVTAGDTPRDGVSKLMDQMFDNAYNESIIAGDLPNVRWGRIDYFNVTYLTTKWNIWSAPFLVILRNRGQELRFYRGQNLRLKEEELRRFLKAEDWKYMPVWSSAYAPGGSRELILHYFATAMTEAYNLAIRIPRWLFVVLTGAIGSMLLKLMHTSAPKPQPQRPPRAPSPASETTNTPSLGVSSSASPKSRNDSAEQRKRR